MIKGFYYSIDHMNIKSVTLSLICFPYIPHNTQYTILEKDGPSSLHMLHMWRREGSKPVQQTKNQQQ